MTLVKDWQRELAVYSDLLLLLSQVVVARLVDRIAANFYRGSLPWSRLLSSNCQKVEQGLDVDRTFRTSGRPHRIAQRKWPPHLAH